MPLILCDLDDTVLQFADAMQAFLATKGRVIAERMRDHHDLQRLYNLSLSETLDLVREFHRSPIMAQLQPEPCARVVLPELYRQGYRFVAITACLDEPEVHNMRVANLEDAFGFPWEAVHCAGLGSDKRQFLSRYEPSVWVEDLFRHAVTGAAFGHRSFVLDRRYNRDHQHHSVTRVNDWYEIAQQLLPR